MEVGENALEVAQSLIVGASGNNWAAIILLVLVIVGIATNTFMGYRRLQSNERVFTRMLDIITPAEPASKRK